MGNHGNPHLKTKIPGTKWRCHLTAGISSRFIADQQSNCWRLIPIDRYSSMLEFRETRRIKSASHPMESMELWYDLQRRKEVMRLAECGKTALATLLDLSNAKPGT